MSHSTNEYVFLNKDGRLPLSSLLTDPKGRGPTVQALNMGFMPYLLPAVTHTKFISAKLRNVDVSFATLDSAKVRPSLMGKPVTVDPRYGYSLYRFSRGPEGEWAYKWEDDWGKLAVEKDKGTYLIDHCWAKKIATDLQSLALCIQDVQRHPGFAKGSPIPPALNSVLLFQHDFTSARQISVLVGIAQISFGMGMAFVNTW